MLSNWFFQIKDVLETHSETEYFKKDSCFSDKPTYLCLSIPFKLLGSHEVGNGAFCCIRYFKITTTLGISKRFLYLDLNPDFLLVWHLLVEDRYLLLYWIWFLVRCTFDMRQYFSGLWTLIFTYRFCGIAGVEWVFCWTMNVKRKTVFFTQIIFASIWYSIYF